jgi:hypothetical protein
MEVRNLKYRLVGLTSKWNKQELSLPQLRQIAQRLHGEWSTEVGEALRSLDLPNSWRQLTIILPASVRWFRSGLLLRRYVAALKWVNDEWKVLFRPIAGGFDQHDYLIQLEPRQPR